MLIPAVAIAPSARQFDKTDTAFDKAAGNQAVATEGLGILKRVVDAIEFQGGLASILQDSATTMWKYSGGKFTLPDAPGLGIAVNENKLQPYIVN